MAKPTLKLAFRPPAWLCVLVALLTCVTEASAFFAKSRPTQLSLGRAVIAPFAYTHFCVRYKIECTAPSGAVTPVSDALLNSELMNDLRRINNAVNRLIEPRQKINDTTFDTWRIAPKFGDCNDFAVTKRHELLSLGWASKALLLAEVLTPSGEHHLVLIARTKDRDLVLDNLNANIKVWSNTPYRWLRVQSPADPPLWLAVNTENVS